MLGANGGRDLTSYILGFWANKILARLRLHPGSAGLIIESPAKRGGGSHAQAPAARQNECRRAPISIAMIAPSGARGATGSGLGVPGQPACPPRGRATVKESAGLPETAVDRTEAGGIASRPGLTPPATPGEHGLRNVPAEAMTRETFLRLKWLMAGNPAGPRER